MRNFLCLPYLKPVLAKMPVYSNWSNGSLLLWISLHWAVMRLGLGELACNYPDVLKHTPEGIYYTKPLFFVIIMVVFSDSILISILISTLWGHSTLLHTSLCKLKMLKSLYIITTWQGSVLGSFAWFLCSPFLVMKLMIIFFFPMKGTKTILHVLGPKYKGSIVLFFQLELNWSIWVFWTFILVILFLIHASVPLTVKFTHFYDIIWTPHLDHFYYGLWTGSMCIFYRTLPGQPPESLNNSPHNIVEGWNHLPSLPTQFIE